jgi:nucleoside 2-deoxyribosyltransferase
VIRVYLAGPDVFRADAEAFGARLKAVCARHGLEGVFPLDPLAAGDDPAWAGLPLAQAIARRNEAHIAGCAALIANLTPFRGPSADAGTVFEIGFARALGRTVFAWSNSGALFAARTRAFIGAAGERDGEGMLIEDFPGLADNLMIEGAIVASGGGLFTADEPEEARWSSLEAFERCCLAVGVGVRK